MANLNAQVVLIDKKDKAIGFKDKVKAHQKPFPLHRAISVVVFDKDRVLIQRRSSLKPTWPLYWSNTCCTHPLKAEGYLKAARRRLKEEMGFDTTLNERFRFIYKTKYNDVYSEHELDAVFVGSYSGKVNPDPKEVADYKWMKISDLLTDVKKNPNLYTPWFKIILQKLNLLTS